MQSRGRAKAVLFGLSVAYIVASFLLKDRLPLENQTPLLWTTAVFSIINIAVLLTQLIRKGTLTPGFILLNLAQLAMFCQLFIQIYGILGADQYACSLPPALYHWMKFVAAHVLSAADVLDIADLYGIRFQEIIPQSALAKAALFALYLLPGIFIAEMIFRLANLSSSEKFSAIMKWIRRISLLTAVALIAVVGLRNQWTPKSSFSWLLYNMLYLADIGDAIQIFGYSFQGAQQAPMLAIFFRLVISAYAVSFLNPLYLRLRGKSVEALCQICVSSEHSSAERILAINALEQLGESAYDAIPHLVKVLVEGNSVLRRAAAQALEKIDARWTRSESVRKAIPQIVKAMAKEDKTTRIASAEALGEIGPAAEKTIPHLVKILGDNDRDVRIAVIEALGKIGTPTILHLVRALADSNSDVRNAAAQTLENIDPQWTRREDVRKEIIRFIEILKNGGDDARAAADAVGKIGSPAAEAVPYLLKALGDINMRTSAAEALGGIGAEAEKAIPYLVKILADGNAAVRQTAAEALGKIDPQWRQRDVVRRAVPGFIKSIGEEEAEFNAPDEALVQIGSASIPYLMGALVSSNQFLIETAGQTLEKINPQWFRTPEASHAVPRLAKALSDSEWYVRHSAADVLGKIGPGAIKAVPYLVKALADKNKTVRSVAKDSLNKVTIRKPAPSESPDEDSEQIPEEDKEIRRLLKDMESNDVAVRLSAVEALGNMEAEASEAVPHLTAALADRENDIREAAALALAKIDPKWNESETVQNLIPQFISALAHEIGTAYDVPDEALVKIGTPAVHPLVEAMADQNQTIVRAVPQILRRIDPKWPRSEGALKAVPRLAQALSDSHWSVRHSAAAVLARIGPGAIKAVPQIVKALRDSNKVVRNAAKEALDKVVIR